MKALLAAAMIAASVLPASAATACGPRSAIASLLADAFDQELRVSAVSGSGLLVEFFVSESGNWTAVVTVPGKASCIFDAGPSWESVPVALPGSDA